MPVSNARKADQYRKASRTRRRAGLAALIFLLSSDPLQNAIADGDTRTIAMKHAHTGEEISITYKRDGRYDEEALKKINWFMRDWRRDEQVRMEPRLIDLLWEAHRELGAKEKIQIICGYRAPQTNAMLRRRSGGVAQTSHHMTGHAIDFFIPGVSLEELRNFGLRMQRGGVGYYPTSGSPFVHLDTGNVRHWPRMTHDQLARVFPNGRTVHVPSDGKPLAGYQLALADVERRGGSPSATSLEAAQATGIDTSATKKLFARLLGLGKGKSDEEIEPDTPAAQKVAEAPARPRQIGVWKRVPGAPSEDRAEPARDAQSGALVPLPKDRPSGNYQLAAAVLPAKTAPAPTAAAANTPNDIIRSRGFWAGLPDDVSASAARRRPVETVPAEPAVTTASIGPFQAPDSPDRAPPGVALAYAAHASVPPQPQAPIGTALPRNAAVGTSTVIKRAGDAAVVIQPLGAVAPAADAVAAAARPTRISNDPWTRAALMTPSVERFMNATLFGMPDFRSLEPLFAPPASTVVMTFTSDPHLGMRSAQFNGPAVVFVATISFNGRSAALQ